MSKKNKNEPNLEDEFVERFEIEFERIMKKKMHPKLRQLLFYILKEYREFIEADCDFTAGNYSNWEEVVKFLLK